MKYLNNKKGKKILLCANTSWYLYNFKKSLILLLLKDGFEVCCICSEDDYTRKLNELGVKLISIKLDSRTIKFNEELKTFIKVYKNINLQNPDFFLGFTAKANIYGSLACIIQKRKYIINITGLGSLFGKKNFKSVFIKFVYKAIFLKSRKVLFQNKELFEYFNVDKEKMKTKFKEIPGSGVDLEYFKKYELPYVKNKYLTITMVSRLLVPKGVFDFIQAIKFIEKSNIDFKAVLVGPLVTKGNGKISSQELDIALAGSSINFHGFSNDVLSVLKKSDIIVLPSYYPEGVPKILIESLAVGRIIVTTNTPGCREVMNEGENGLFCQPRNAEDIAEKLLQLLQLNKSALINMSNNSRKLAEQKFNEDIINNEYIFTVRNENK
jgi:glycosyltransferase involved in cell wall biosynthesis